MGKIKRKEKDENKKKKRAATPFGTFRCSAAAENSSRD